MYLHNAQLFWNLDNYRSVFFDMGTEPGEVEVELINTDGEKESFTLCISTLSDEDIAETIQREFMEALDQGRGVFDLDQYFDRFEDER